MAKKQPASKKNGVHKVFQSYDHHHEDPKFQKTIEESLEKFNEEETKREEKKAIQEKEMVEKEILNTEKKRTTTPPKEKKILPFWADLLLNIIILGLLLFVFRTFIFSPFNVDGPSMEGTLHNGEFIYVDKLLPMFQGYERGNIVVFLPPTDTITEETGLMCAYDTIKNIVLFEGKEDPCQVAASFVKRIIGIPGDIIEIQKGSVYITPKNGKKYNASESYLLDENKERTCLPANFCLSSKNEEGKTYGPVPEGEFFVLGDNRTHSSDSRSRRWESAFVAEDKVIGIARAVFLSPTPIDADQRFTFLQKISLRLVNIPKSFSGIRSLKSEEVLGEPIEK